MQAKFPKYIVKIFNIGHSKSDFRNLLIKDGKFFIYFCPTKSLSNIILSISQSVTRYMGSFDGKIFAGSKFRHQWVKLTNLFLNSISLHLIFSLIFFFLQLSLLAILLSSKSQTLSIVFLLSNAVVTALRSRIPLACFT